jgi:hypothetical protein
MGESDREAPLGRPSAVMTNAGGGTVSNSVVYFAAGTIPAGGSISYAITLKVAAGAHGKALLAAAAASTQIKDPNYYNNATASIIALGATPERWIRHKILYRTEHFGWLRAGAASQLYENYRIVRQRPLPGAELKLGVSHRISATSGSFLPTPLTLWLSQDRQGH